MTQTDLDALESRRHDEVRDALALADKKVTRRLTVVGLAMTAVIAVANYVSMMR